jgi:hypothetical protein
MKQKLTEILGYYFVIFQRNLAGNMVKCYIDGDEDYVLMDKEYFLELSQKAGYNPLGSKLLGCLDTTSIYVWDVEENTVSKLHTQSGNTSGLNKMISSAAKDILANRKEDILSYSFPNKFLQSKGNGKFIVL